MVDILFDIGTAAAGAASGLGSILGGALQNKAQKSANRTNLQIAQETNQLQREMFNEQLHYNSFQNQRQMLEDAGYSPYSLFGTSSVSAPSAPQLQTPTMIPTDALGVGIGNAMGNLAGVAKAFAEARSANEDAKTKRIHNAVYQTELYNNLVSQGLQNEWQEIQNYIAEGSKEDQMNTFGLQNELMHGQWKLTMEQYNLAVIEAGLRKEYGSRLNEAELEKKAADAFAAWQKGWLDQGELAHIDDKYKAMLMSSEAAQSQAETARLRAPAQNALDYANANTINYELKELKKLGWSRGVAEINHLLQQDWFTSAQGNYTYEQTKQVRKVLRLLDEEIEKASTDNDFNRVEHLNKLFTNFVSLMQGGSSSRLLQESLR